MSQENKQTNMSTIKQAEKYAIELGGMMTSVGYVEFFEEMYKRFFQHIDIHFMEYFMSIIPMDGEFVVPHQKLVEYGVMTSTQSCDVSKKLNTLGFIKGVDYLLRDVSENLPNGGRPSKQYTLTPDAFKLCLIRAQRRANQPVDPVIYGNYFLLLEKIHMLFGRYTEEYNKKKIEVLKTDKRELKASAFDLKASNDELKASNEDLQHKMDELLKMSSDIHESNKQLHEDNTDLIDRVDNLTDMMHGTNDTIMNMMTMQVPNTDKSLDPMLCVQATPYMGNDGLPYVLIEMVRRQRKSMVDYVKAGNGIAYTLIYPFILPSQPNLCNLVRTEAKKKINSKILDYNMKVGKGMIQDGHPINRMVFNRSVCKWGAREITLYANDIVDLEFVLKLFVEKIIEIRVFNHQDDDIRSSNKEVSSRMFALDQLESSKILDFMSPKRSLSNADKLVDTHSILKSTVESQYEWLTREAST